MLLCLVEWRGQRTCTLSYSSIHGQQLCRRLEVHPGSLLRIRLSWLFCVRSRQVLLVVELFLLLKKCQRSLLSFGPAVDQGHKSLAEMREERDATTSGVVVLCIFSLGWVSWRGVYLLFQQLQQLPSACFPRRVT